MLEKVLGGIDLLAGCAFLMIMFGITPFVAYMVFCGVLLLLKSLFILGGDVLSWIDLFSGIALLLSIFFDLNILFLWLPAFLLISKSIASFV